MPTPIGTSGNRRVTCQNCGTEMSFMLSEVRVGARIQGSDDDEYESVVKCPTVRCGRTVKVTHLVGPRSAQQAYDQEMDY